MQKMTIYLEEDEMEALFRISREDMRSRSDQARFILRQELSRRGLLPLAGPGKIESNMTTLEETRL